LDACFSIIEEPIKIQKCVTGSLDLHPFKYQNVQDKENYYLFLPLFE